MYIHIYIHTHIQTHTHAHIKLVWGLPFMNKYTHKFIGCWLFLVHFIWHWASQVGIMQTHQEDCRWLGVKLWWSYFGGAFICSHSEDFYGFQLRTCYTRDFGKNLSCNSCYYLINSKLFSRVSHVFISAVPWRISGSVFLHRKGKKRIIQTLLIAK